MKNVIWRVKPSLRRKLSLAAITIVSTIGVQAGGNLPAGYAEVEYLRLTGKQYADMGMKLTHLHKVEIVYQCDASGKQLVFGSRTDAKNNNFLYMLDGSNVLDFDNTKGTSIKYRLTWAREYGEKLFVSASNMERICRRGSSSGEVVANAHNTDAISESLTTPKNCRLGSANATISGFQGLVGRIYSFRISDTRTGRVYRQLVPSVRQSDGVAGFYDVADHSEDSGYEPFYPSVGTAAFLPSEVPLSLAAKPTCTVNGNGTLDVTFNPSAIPLVLYLAYGMTDAGDTTNGWDRVVNAGTVEAKATEVREIPLPDDWGTDTLAVRAFLCAQSDALSAADYVKDGLVVLYDARENNGFGEHSAGITHWKDLSGNGYDMNLKVSEGHITVREDDIKFSSLAKKPTDSAWAGDDRPQVAEGDISEIGPKTLEVVARTDDTFNSTMVGKAIDLAYLGAHGMISFSPTDGQNLVGKFVDSSKKSHSFCDASSPYDTLASIRTLRSYSATFNTADYTGDTLRVDDYPYVTGAGTQTGNPEDIDYRCRLILGLNKADAYFSSVRLYNRVLTDAERIWNARVDRVRYQGGDLVASEPCFAPVSFKIVSLNRKRGKVAVAKIVLPASDALKEVLVAWARKDAGADISNWDNVAHVAEIPANTTACDVTFPDSVVEQWTGNVGIRLFVRPIRTSRDYVLDGLVVMYDARENNGFGEHSADITHWKDLSGNGCDMDLKVSEGHITVRDDDIKFSPCRTKQADPVWAGDDRPQVADGNISVIGPKTMEVVARADDTFNSTMVDATVDLAYLGAHGMISFSPTAGQSLVGKFVDSSKKSHSFCDASSPYDSLASIRTLRSYSATFNTADYTGDTLRVDDNPYVTGAGTQTGGPASIDSKCRLILGLNRSDAYFSSVRLYNRVLTDEERSWNARVDRERYQAVPAATDFRDVSPLGLIIVVQ